MRLSPPDWDCYNSRHLLRRIQQTRGYRAERCAKPSEVTLSPRRTVASCEPKPSETGGCVIRARPFRFGVTCELAADRDAWRTLCRRVEDRGFSNLWVSDHLGDQLALIPALAA